MLSPCPRKRRAKDREIQARKAAELRKKKRGKLGGAQEKAKGMKDRFGRLKNKLTQGERCAAPRAVPCACVRVRVCVCADLGLS